MSQLPVALKSMTINVQPPAQGKVTITSPPSAISSVQGTKVHIGPMFIYISQITQGPLGSLKSGIAFSQVLPKAKNSRSEGRLMMRQNDTSPLIKAKLAYHPGPGGAPVPSPIFFTVKIEQSGQSLSKSV